MKRKRGFTFTEFLVSIAILVIIGIFMIAVSYPPKPTSKVYPGPQGTMTQVDTVPLGINWNDAKAVDKAINKWILEHPQNQVISIVKSEDPAGGVTLTITSSVIASEKK